MTSNRSSRVTKIIFQIFCFLKNMKQRVSLNEDYVLTCAEYEYPFIKALENRIIRRVIGLIDFRLGVFEKDIISKLGEIPEITENDYSENTDSLFSEDTFEDSIDSERLDNIDDSKKLSESDEFLMKVIKILLESRTSNYA